MRNPAILVSVAVSCLAWSLLMPSNAAQQPPAHPGVGVAGALPVPPDGQRGALERAFAPPRPAAADAGTPAVIAMAPPLPPTGLAPTRALMPLSPIEERAVQPRDVFKECTGCPRMVVVPAGSFLMGSPDDKDGGKEEGRYDNEGPQRLVTIARPFAVGTFEITFAEWDACAADGGCGGHRPGDSGWGRGRRPVIDVSWNDAQLYVHWLSRKTGKPYRLLTEAEWEYAARAGTKTPFWWGSDISTDRANYDGAFIYGEGAKGLSRLRTVEVDAFAPNAFGLHNVHGNVWEWVEDCYAVGKKNRPSDGSAFIAPNCGRRVMRGGSWASKPSHVRAALCGYYLPGGRDQSVGFRIARTLG